MCAGDTCHIFLIYFVCQMVSGVEKTFNPGKRGKECMCVCVFCVLTPIHVCVCVCFVQIPTFGREHDFRLGSCMGFPLLL